MKALVLIAVLASLAAGPVAVSHASGAAPPRSYSFKVGDLKYHGGPVMRSSTSYVIWWQPRGTHYEPHGSDRRYKRLIRRYLRDIGGTPLYNTLTQYSRGPAGRPSVSPRVLKTRRYSRLVAGGPILNQSGLGGATLDQSPYPHAGTRADPLRYLDFLPVVRRAMRKYGWTAGLTHIFYVFTAGHPRECFVAHRHCIPSQGCSTHLSYGSASHPIIVGLMADVALYPGCRSPETNGKFAHRSVNHDTLADFEITILSHEQFEAVTDPVDGNSVTPASTNAWYDSNPDSGEIGDKCESILDVILSTKIGNVVLHGHRYHVQEEWSNADHNCVFRYPAR